MQQDELSKRLEKQIAEGTELQAFRARQMLELVKEGEIKDFIPELVLTVLESILIKNMRSIEVGFLDGTAYEIKF